QIEVNDGVIFTAGSDPGIDGLPLDLLCSREYGDWSSGQKKTLIWRHGASVDLQTARVCAFNQLPMGLDLLLDGRLFGGIYRENVVLPHLHDYVSDARVREYIAIEAGQSVRAERIMKHSAARDSEVEYAGRMLPRCGDKPLSK